MSRSGLEQQANDFAAQLSATVSALAPECSPFAATVIDKRGRDERPKFVVEQQPLSGIPILVDGAPLLNLKVKFHCCLDSRLDFLAVDTSVVQVFAVAQAAREPLFRYEYVRDANSIPAAHIHVHAHRDAVAFVMTRSGKNSRRGEERAKNQTVPELRELHFPVGGHRFRPCLEDVLEMLVTEFGADCDAAGLAALKSGRESWRTSQLKTVVRDNPVAAAKALRREGYEVTWAKDTPEPSGKPERFTDF